MSGEHIVQNNTFLTLGSGLSVADVTAAFSSGHGIRLNAVVAPQFIFATLVRAATGELERIKITAHTAAADSATIVRGVDGTTPLTFVAGDRLELRIGKSDFDQIPRLGLSDNTVVAGGTADVITGTLANTGLISLPDKFIIFLVGASANQANNPTLNLTLAAVTAAKTIVKGNGVPLAGGDISPCAMLMYRTGSDNWTLLNPYYGSMQAGDYVDSGNPLLTRTGFLLPNGATFARSSNAALLAALTTSATATISIASPGVITWNSHPVPENGEITLSTTGALPTGLGAGIVGYAKNVALNTFQVAATPGGAAINTTGSQSGVHTVTYYPHGAGDGSTTARVPDRAGRNRKGQGVGTFSISVDAAQVSTVTDDFTIPTNIDSVVTGMKGQFTTTGALPTATPALSLATDYWLVKTAANKYKIATSLANSQNGTVIDITVAGSGVHTFTQTLSTRAVGTKGGEEAHADTSAETLSHNHSGSTFPASTTSSPGTFAFHGNSFEANQPISIAAFGGNTAANNESPFGVDTFWIKT